MTISVPMEDRYLLTEPELQDRLAVLLGGRAAEEIVLENISTGAADDLQKATDIARRMVEQFGMSPKVGPIAVTHDASQFLEAKFPWDGQKSTSEELARKADEEVTRIVSDAAERAKVILTTHEASLRAVADELKRAEVIEGAALKALVERVELASDPRS
jgi:cell division protease FtsH